MVETVAAVATFALVILAFWFLTDSDDDNSGGGLMEPALIPISSRERQI